MALICPSDVLRGEPWRTTTSFRLTLCLQLAVIFRSAFGGCLSADPAGLGDDEFFRDGFSAVWTFHEAQTTTRLVECLVAGTI